MTKGRYNFTCEPKIIEQAKARADELGAPLSLVVERLLAQWVASGAGVPPKADKPANGKKKK